MVNPIQNKSFEAKIFFLLKKNMLNTRHAKMQLEYDKLSKESATFLTEDIQAYDTHRKKIMDVLRCLDQIELEQRSLQLQMDILEMNEKNLVFDRIIIGSGFAGTALFSEFSDNMRHKISSNGLPNIIALNNPADTNQWRKDGAMLMGQPALIQTPQCFSNHSEDFSDEHQSTRNPFSYVMSNDFDSALISTQCAMGMNILNAVAITIENKTDYDQSVAWQYSDQPQRICILLINTFYYLYTSHIDLCTGTGPSRKLASKQIAKNTEVALIAQDKLIYGQDHSTKTLKGNVCFYGGGARNAALILDIINGHQPLVTTFTWITPKNFDFDVTSKLNRMFTLLHNNLSAHRQVGELITALLDDNDQLVLTFRSPSDERNPASEIILCDQLVVSIGQEPSYLIKNFSNFEPCLLEYTLEDTDITELIPLGTYSQDGSVCTWGALGTQGIGLTTTEKNKFQLAVFDHAQTMPMETQATTSIFRCGWTIQMMAKKLREERPDIMPPNDSPHKYDIPNINLATQNEIYSLVRSALPQESMEKCLELVNTIILLRTTLPLGLTHFASFENLLPEAVVNQIKALYFPFGDIHATDADAYNKGSSAHL